MFSPSSAAGPAGRRPLHAEHYLLFPALVVFYTWHNSKTMIVVWRLVFVVLFVSELLVIGDSESCLTVDFAGRTGNLMFEYATLVGVCTARGQDYRTCARLSIPGWTFWPVDEFVKEFNLTSADCKVDRKLMVSEKVASYDEDIMKAPTGSVLHGWLQSWKYFHPHASNIVHDTFIIPAKSAAPADEFISQIRYQTPPGTFLIAVHVRVGDKIHDPQFQHRYDQWSLSEHYYKKAIRLLQLRHPQSALVIFSGGGETKDDLRNDRQWTKERFGKEGTLVFFDESENHFTSLRAIGLCDAVVIAHSTFSWWAAYLSSTLEVVAPYHFYTSQIEAEKQYRVEDYYLPWWSVISQNSSEDRIVGWNPLPSHTRKAAPTHVPAPPR